jgi:hypothetical protein
LGPRSSVPRPRNRIFFILRVDRKKGQKDKKEAERAEGKIQILRKKMRTEYRAGGLLPGRRSENGVECLLLRELRYNEDVLHVAGGRVEPRDGGIRDTIRREFIEEVGAWPVDLTQRISNATLRNVARGYCLATIDVTDVDVAPPGNTHWVPLRDPWSEPEPDTVAPLSWLAKRCVSSVS